MTTRQNTPSYCGHTLASLQHFDVLPNSAHVREPVARAVSGASHATIWRWVKVGKFPAPRKLSERINAWNVGELRAWLNAQGGAA